jgi:hypothetical protein
MSVVKSTRTKPSVSIPGFPSGMVMKGWDAPMR